MAPLAVAEVRDGAVGDAPLVPHHDRALLPPDAAAEVEAPDVLVEERQQGARLLGEQALDPARDGRVHEQRGLAGDRVADDQRVGRADGLPQRPLRADPRDLPDRGRRVEEGQRREQAPEGRGERLVRGRQGREGRVAAAGLRGLEDPEERRRRHVSRERLVHVPEIVGRARAKEGPEVAPGSPELVRFFPPTVGWGGRQGVLQCLTRLHPRILPGIPAQSLPDSPSSGASKRTRVSGWP